MEKTKPLPIVAKLIDKKQLTHDVVELYFESTPHFDFLPGQFVSIMIPGAGPGGRDLRRAYSIASEPEKTVFELCVKIVEGGPGTSFLNGLKIGDELKGIAPYGDFTYKIRPGRAAIMIATGTGIAPFRSMVFSKIFKDNLPTDTQIIFGARDITDLLYTEELEKELADDFVQVLSRTSEEWVGFKGRVTDWLRHHASHIAWKETEFYLCGNGAMIDEVKQILSLHGVEKPSIHQEVYYKPKADGRPDADLD
jgi:ferredoxin-NADP reductase